MFFLEFGNLDYHQKVQKQKEKENAKRCGDGMLKVCKQGRDYMNI